MKLSEDLFEWDDPGTALNSVTGVEQTIITRAEAKERGLKRYFTGVPCKNGHVAERNGSSRNCIECKRQEKREKYRNDPEYAERERQYHHEKYHNDPEYAERERKYHRERRANDPEYAERERKYKRERRANDPEWAERERMRCREYKKNNPGRMTALQAKRRAAKIQRTPSWADLDGIESIYTTARHMTVNTGIEHHVDHIIPLRGTVVSGLHVVTNLQIMEGGENTSKSNHFDPEKFEGP